MPRFPGIPGSQTPAAISSAADAMARLKAMKDARKAGQRENTLAAIGLGIQGIETAGGIGTDIGQLIEAAKRREQEAKDAEQARALTQSEGAADRMVTQSEGGYDRESRLQEARITAEARPSPEKDAEAMIRQIEATDLLRTPGASPEQRRKGAIQVATGQAGPESAELAALQQAAKIASRYAAQLGLPEDDPYDPAAMGKLKREDILALTGGIASQTQDRSVLDAAIARVMQGVGGSLPEQDLGMLGVPDFATLVDEKKRQDFKKVMPELEDLFRALQPQEPGFVGPQAPVPQLSPEARAYIQRRLGK